MLDVFVTLPAAVYDTPTLHRLGADLRFWGLGPSSGWSYWRGSDSSLACEPTTAR
jgi:hypothetical protein